MATGLGTAVTVDSAPTVYGPCPGAFCAILSHLHKSLWRCHCCQKTEEEEGRPSEEKEQGCGPWAAKGGQH